MLFQIIFVLLYENNMVKIDKLKDLEYNELITLAVIEKDEDLKDILVDTVSSSFNLILTLAKEDKLSDDTKQFIRSLFDKVILSKPLLIDWYLRFMSHETSTEKEPIQEVIEPIPTKKTKEKGLPRRYGKANIVKDIEKQGGKATNAQLTALSVNELKNIYVNLNSRLVNDLLTDKPKLTDEDYRVIRSTIKIVENKINPILKKK